MARTSSPTVSMADQIGMAIALRMVRRSNAILIGFAGWQWRRSNH